MNRMCTKCKKEKELDYFIKNKICKNGRAFTCKVCQNNYNKKWKQKNSTRISARRRELYYFSQGLSSKKRIKERELIRERNKPFTTRARILRAGILERSKKGIITDFGLFTVPYITNWLKIQDVCLCCGIKLDIKFKHDKKPHNNSPSLDRFYPKLGYVKGNVVLLCWRCNNLKRDATSNELRTIANWMDTLGNDEKLSHQPLEAFL